AGVIMNVILAAICFIIVYSHGVERQPAVVGMVDPGGPLWQKGVPEGAQIVQVGTKAPPPGHELYFQQLQNKVIFSSKGEELPLAYLGPTAADANARKVIEVEPRKDESMGIPRLGL